MRAVLNISFLSSAMQTFPHYEIIRAACKPQRERPRPVVPLPRNHRGNARPSGQYALFHPCRLRFFHGRDRPKALVDTRPGGPLSWVHRFAHLFIHAYSTHVPGREPGLPLARLRVSQPVIAAPGHPGNGGLASSGVRSIRRTPAISLPPARRCASLSCRWSSSSPPRARRTRARAGWPGPPTAIAW